MARKSIYSKKLGGAVADSAKGSAPGKFHIISSQSGKWAVISDGTVRPVRAFYSRQKAGSFARQYALAQSAGEVVIHGEDGSIENRISV